MQSNIKQIGISKHTFEMKTFQSCCNMFQMSKLMIPKLIWFQVNLRKPLCDIVCFV